MDRVQTTIRTKSTWKIWLQAIRPKTLTAALIPVLVGTALAHGTLFLMISILFTAFCIQIGTNLINDAIDFKRGTDTAERLGPQRVTQSGLLPMQTVYNGGLIAFLLAALFSIPLVIKGGTPIAMLLAISIVCGYYYTGGSKPLSYLGIADLFVFLFFGLINITAVYFIYTDSFSWKAVLAGSQIGFLATVIIAINNLRDWQTDSKANKKTIPVRFGTQIAKIVIVFITLLPFVLNLLWFSFNHQLAGLLPFLTLPFAIGLLRSIWKTAPGKAYNAFFSSAALLHLLFGIFLALSLL